MSIKCAIFDVDLTKLTAKELNERCKNCLEKTGGEYCSHITIEKSATVYRIYKDSEGSCSILGEVYRDVTKEEYDRWSGKKEII